MQSESYEALRDEKYTHKWWVFCVAVCISHFPSFSFPRFNIMKHAAVQHFYAAHALFSITEAIVHFHLNQKSIRTLLSRVGGPKWNSTHPCCCCHFLLISRVNTNKSREVCAHTPQHALTRHFWYIPGYVSEPKYQILTLRPTACCLFLRRFDKTSPCHAWNKHEA